MAHSVERDEMAIYEPSHLDLHCLHRYLNWYTGLKGLKHENPFIYLLICQKTAV